MEQLIEQTVGGLLEEQAKKYPTHLFAKYIDKDYERTYKEFDEECDAYAKGLLKLGFKNGDHLAVWATNYPEWLISLFACAKIGVVLVTVNTNYKIHELEYLLTQSDSKGLVFCDGLKDIDCIGILNELCPELKEENINITNLNLAKFDRLKCIFSIDNDYKGTIRFKNIIDYGKDISNETLLKAKSEVHFNDTVNMQYTSGTTGFPKGVMLSHYNIVNNGKGIGDCMKFTDKDKLCIPVPFFHCFGLVLAIMASVTHGTGMVPLHFFNAVKAMRAISEEKCTAIHGVPTMYISILEHPDFEKYNFSSLRTGIMAGSPCPAKIMQEVIDKMNMKEITITYGLTEASPACTMTRTTDSVELRVNTVGRHMPFVETRIVDPDTNEELPPNTNGEFVSRGYNTMKGYYNMPGATAMAIDKDGWLHSGDLAQVDENGYYRITGRIKDMIIRGGENIYPKEIEEFIYTHKEIKDVQVIGVPSQKWGEEVMACVILKQGSALTEEELREYITKAIARHKVPRYIKFMDAFPMTASGKIQKYKLREWAVKVLEIDEKI